MFSLDHILLYESVFSQSFLLFGIFISHYILIFFLYSFNDIYTLLIIFPFNEDHNVIAAFSRGKRSVLRGINVSKFYVVHYFILLYPSSSTLSTVIS